MQLISLGVGEQSPGQSFIIISIIVAAVAASCTAADNNCRAIYPPIVPTTAGRTSSPRRRRVPRGRLHNFWRNVQRARRVMAPERKAGHGRGRGIPVTTATAMTTTTTTVAAGEAIDVRVGDGIFGHPIFPGRVREELGVFAQESVIGEVRCGEVDPDIVIVDPGEGVFFARIAGGGGGGCRGCREGSRGGVAVDGLIADGVEDAAAGTG